MQELVLGFDKCKRMLGPMGVSPKSCASGVQREMFSQRFFAGLDHTPKHGVSPHPAIVVSPEQKTDPTDLDVTTQIPCGHYFNPDIHPAFSKGTLLGTPNREPQEYSRYRIGIYLPGSLYSILFLLYSWGSLFGVPIRVPSFSEDVSRAAVWMNNMAPREQGEDQLFCFRV